QFYLAQIAIGLIQQIMQVAIEVEWQRLLELAGGCFRSSRTQIGFAQTGACLQQVGVVAQRFLQVRNSLLLLSPGQVQLAEQVERARPQRLQLQRLLEGCSRFVQRVFLKVKLPQLFEGQGLENTGLIAAWSLAISNHQ